MKIKVNKLFAINVAIFSCIFAFTCIQQAFAESSVWVDSTSNVKGEYIKPLNDIQTDLPAGEYYITTSYASSKALDVANGSSGSGANVQIYDANYTKAQKWTLSYDADGYAYFQNASGKYLDVSGGKASSGQNVWQYSKNNTVAQKWVITKQGTNYMIQSALSTESKSLVLDIAGALSDNGTNVQIYTSNNSSAQRFVFTKTSGLSLEGGNDISDGEYNICSFKKSSQVVDIAGGSSSNCANVQMYASNGTTAQNFHFAYDETTKCYVIYCVGTGKVLDVSGGSLFSGANVQQYVYNGTDAQLWAITKQSDNSFMILNRRNGLALDIAGGLTSNGANVQVYTSNNTSAQRFTLKAATLFNEGIFNLRSLVSDNAVIDVDSGSWSSGTQLQIWDSDGNINQKFSAKTVSGTTDTYQLRSVVSGLFIADNGSSKVVQTSVDNKNAQWKASWGWNGIMFTNVGTGKAIQVSGSGSANGTKLITASPSDSNNRQSFTYVSTTILQNNQIYEMQPQCAEGCFLNLDGWNWNQGANVHIWSGSQANSQWIVEQVNDAGWYMIKNALTGYVLDVSGGSSAAGANVQQYGWNGSAAQCWGPTFTDDGYITFVNAVSGAALDVCGAGSGAGTNVDVYPVNNTWAQKWRIRGVGRYSFSGDSELDEIIRDMDRCHPSCDNVFNYIVSFNYYDGDKWPSGEWSIPYAKQMYYNHGGNCYRFAALFKWCARGFGVNSEVISGQVPSNSGGLAPHGWVEVNGNLVCDPDLAHELPGHNWYMVPYSQAPTTYYK